MPSTGAYTRHLEKFAQRDKMKSESKHHKTSSKDPMGNDELLPHAVRTALVLADTGTSMRIVRGPFRVFRGCRAWPCATCWRK